MPGDERSEARDRCLGATTYTWSATTPPPSHLWLRVVATSSLLLLLPWDWCMFWCRAAGAGTGAAETGAGGVGTGAGGAWWLGVGFFGRGNTAVKKVWTPGGR